MPQGNKMNSVLTRPGAVQSTPRDKLRAAISAHAEETHRLAALEQARERARTEKHAARDHLIEAEADLDEARQAEPQALAYAFANNQPIDDGLLAEKQAELDTQARAVHRAERVEQAIEAEIEESERRLHRREHDKRAVLAEVVCNSSEFQAILQAQAQAWAVLRTMRHIGIELVLPACAGYAPNAVYSKLQNVEPLENRVGWDIDEKLIEEWRSALAQLATDADAALPH
jgi:hypothetical protein